MSKHEQVIHKAMTNGLLWMEGKGFEWFARKYIKSLDLMVSNERQAPCAAFVTEAYRLTGDLYYVNHAHRSAIQYFQRALRVSSDPGIRLEILLDIAASYSFLMDRERARHYYELVLKESKDNEEAKLYISEHEERVPRDASWRSEYERQCVTGYEPLMELLMNHEPREVLRVIKTKKSVGARRCRAMAYSLLGDVESFIEEWERILKLSKNVEIMYKDWFFVSADIWNSAVFWRMLRTNVKNIATVALQYCGKAANGESSNVREPRAIISIHLGRITRDVKQLDKIIKEFPHCPELNKLHSKLERNARITLTPELKGFAF